MNDSSEMVHVSFVPLMAWLTSMKRRERMRFSAVLLAALIVIMPLCIVILNNYQGNVRMKGNEFAESSRELRNPDRGFYHLYRFMVTDEKVNYWQQIQDLYKTDEDTSLSMVEINLQNYRGGEISEAGMANIEMLFQALGELDKRLVVRFLYDWDGESEKYEPETIDIILRHMEQLEDVLKESDRQIFVLQGLFTGNWGEMNGTKYFADGDLARLSGQLHNVAGRSVYFAVRTPQQWRRITGLKGASDLSDDFFEMNPLAGRISLYNDGMLGSESDYGSYRVQEVGGRKISERKEELNFQDELCRRVPNGGEVIHDNYYNDFSNAVKDMSLMHVTYLNKDHDQAVLDKWRNTEITENGCYKGMDGYTYIERHLGYRLLIKKAHLKSFGDYIEVYVVMDNVGFAPLYFKPEIELILCNKEGGEYLTYKMEGDLRELVGGNEEGKSLALKAEIPLDDLLPTKYEVYFSISHPSTGQRILLANEQDIEEYGYSVGTIERYE